MTGIWADTLTLNQTLHWLEAIAILAIFYLKLKEIPNINSITYFFFNSWLYFFILTIACLWSREWPIWGHTGFIFLFMIIFSLRFAFLSIAIYPAFIEISGLTNKEDTE